MVQVADGATERGTSGRLSTSDAVDDAETAFILSLRYVGTASSAVTMRDSTLTTAFSFKMKT